MGHFKLYNENQKREINLFWFLFFANKMKWIYLFTSGGKEKTMAGMKPSKGWKNKILEVGIAFIAVVGLVYLLGLKEGDSTAKCMEYECDSSQAEGSYYCSYHEYLHQQAIANQSTSTYSARNQPTSTYSTSRTSKSYYSSSDATKRIYQYHNYNKGSYKDNYKSNKNYDDRYDDEDDDGYDDGYDDVQMEGDYDDERYDEDSDYADGVDDAIEEEGEDW